MQLASLQDEVYRVYVDIDKKMSIEMLIDSRDAPI